MVLFFVERLKVHCDLTKGNDEEECESVREERSSNLGLASLSSISVEGVKSSVKGSPGLASPAP